MNHHLSLLYPEKVAGCITSALNVRIWVQNLPAAKIRTCVFWLDRNPVKRLKMKRLLFYMLNRD